MNIDLTNDTMATLSNSTLIVVAIVFTILHAVLFACIVVFKKRLHPMYFMFLLLATLLYVSPFINVATSNTGRWLRLYIIVVTTILGLLLYRPKRIGLPAKASLLFALYMMLNAARTSDPAAISYKGIFLVSLLAGLMIAHSIQDQQKVFKQMHWFVALMAVYSINFAYYIATNPVFTTGRRLCYGHLGPVSLAASTASVVVLCAFITMYDPSKMWKALSAFVCVVMGTVVLLTGSRGPTAAAIGACFCMAIPLIKRPSQLILVVLLIGIGITVVASSGIEIPQLMRAVGLDQSNGGSLEETLNGRLQLWNAALGGFRQNPLLGCGYAQTGTVVRQMGKSVHSSYIQIIAEGGIVGSVFFAICGSVILYSLFVVFTKGSKRPEIGSLRCLPVGCLAFGCLFGIGEASALYGTTFCGVLIALGIGYTDWMYLAIRQPQTAEKKIFVKRKVAMPIRPRFFPGK